MKAADPFTGDAVVERQPGQFARHAKTGAPYVAHPTETTKHSGKKADLIALCAARSIPVALRRRLRRVSGASLAAGRLDEVA